MSEDPGEPLDAGTPDEASELYALSRAVLFGKGFKLLLVRYRGEAHRLRLNDALRTTLPGKRIREVSLDRDSQHLLDVLRGVLGDDRPDAVSVSGFDRALPDPASAQSSPLVANLNASRDSFSIVVPCPLLLWVPEYVLVAIARGAPDFFSGRSAAYLFDAPVPELEALAEELDQAVEDAPRLLSVKQRLLAYLDRRPSADSIPEREARILSQLGESLQRLGLWAEVIVCDQRALDTYGTAAPDRWRAMVLRRIGEAQRRLGKTTQARMVFDRSFEAVRAGGDDLLSIIPPDNAWATIRNLAEQVRPDVALQLDRTAQWEMLLRVLNQPKHTLILLYGQRQQYPGYFVARIQRYLDDRAITLAAPGPRQRAFYFASMESLLREALSRTQDVVSDREALSADSGSLLGWATYDGPLFLIIGDRPISQLTSEDEQALSYFLGERLPGLLAFFARHPVRVLLPVEYGGRKRPSLIKLARKWGKQAVRNGLRFVELPELTMPTWEDVEEFLLNGRRRLSEDELREIRGECDRLTARSDASFLEVAQMIERHLGE